MLSASAAVATQVADPADIEDTVNGKNESTTDGTLPPPKAKPEKPQIVKLSFNVAPYQVETLRQLAETRHVSMTEVLRHAIALEDFVQRELAVGSRLVVETREGDRKEVVLIGP